MKKFIYLFIGFFSFFLLLLTCGKNVYAEEVKSIINIETPSQNSIYKNKLDISGWVMSNSNKSTIKIYINDKEIDNVNRIERNDVLKAIKNYGDKNNNPNPGFNSVIDLTDYKDGIYTIKVDVLNENKVINFSSCNVKVKKANGILNVENFNDKIEGKNIILGGWYLTDLPGSILKIYIDNNEINDIDMYTRSDVFKVIKNYGDSSTTPKPGFYKNIDLSSYLNGTHTISIKVINPNTNEVIVNDNKKIYLNKSKSLLTIEEPNKVNVNSFELKISGWVMNTNIDDKIKIKIDNDYVPVNMISRNDVLRAIKNFPHNSINEQPGFNSIINLKNYDDGKHTITVENTNSLTNEIVNSKSLIVNVNKYNSKLVLEEPTGIVKGNLLNVSGWLMSTDSNQKLKAYLNNEELPILDRNNRNDVLKAVKGYGDINTTPKPGFNKKIDISNFVDGKYNLKIVAFDSDTDKKLSEVNRKITINKYKSILNVETKENINVSTSINVNGWLMSTCSDVSIYANIDNDQYLINNRINRNDVLRTVKGYGDNNTTPKPGFNEKIDLSKYKDGSHLLKVIIKDNKTGEILVQKTQKFMIKKYKALVTIEKPISNDISYGIEHELSGWVMTDCPYAVLKVFIDNKEMNNHSFDRIKRNDVLKAIKGYGDSNTNSNAGFSTKINLSSFKDGKHSIKIYVYNEKTNEVINYGKQDIVIKKYKGKLNLESPIRSTFNSTFIVSGWEMSESSDSIIEVLIDNNNYGFNIDRFSRGDVVNSIKGYGDESVNQTAGFESKVNLINISEGKHVLTVKLRSKYGDILDSITKEIFIYNKLYFGVDISYYQSNVDFKTLKNEGIDFTIIRLGYRGYGTGSLNLDLKYDKHVTDAINNNMDFGLYFFSSAINETEALEEANYVINNINIGGYGNKIKYPIVFDTEFSSSQRKGRADGLTKQERTNIAKTFLNRIKQAGFTPMLYASKSFLYDNLDMNQLKDYDVWVAHYNGTTDPINNTTDYTGIYQMWQYTSKGQILGINGNVDLNISYKKY